MRKHKLPTMIKLSAVVLLTVAVFVCVQRRDLQINNVSSVPSDICISKPDGISLDITEISYEDKKITLILKNKTNDTIGYYPYNWGLEIFIKNTWFPINKHVDYIEAPAITSHPLKSMDSKEITLNWGYMYGELDAGMYRLYFSLMDIGGDTVNIGVEFRIEK